MEKYNRYSELFWLFVTVATFAMVIYLIILEGFESSKWYLFVPLLAAAMYIMRRSLRIRFEKQKEESNQKKNKQ